MELSYTMRYWVYLFSPNINCTFFREINVLCINNNFFREITSIRLILQMELMELSVVGFVDLVKNFKKIALFVEFMIAFFKGQEQTRLWLQDHLNCVFFRMKSSKPLNIGFPLYKICYLNSIGLQLINTILFS